MERGSGPRPLILWSNIGSHVVCTVWPSPWSVACPFSGEDGPAVQSCLAMVGTSRHPSSAPTTNSLFIPYQCTIWPAVCLPVWLVLCHGTTAGQRGSVVPRAEYRALFCTCVANTLLTCVCHLRAFVQLKIYNGSGQ